MNLCFPRISANALSMSGNRNWNPAATRRPGTTRRLLIISSVSVRRRKAPTSNIQRVAGSPTRTPHSRRNTRIMSRFGIGFGRSQVDRAAHLVVGDQPLDGTTEVLAMNPGDILVSAAHRSSQSQTHETTEYIEHSTSSWGEDHCGSHRDLAGAGCHSLFKRSFPGSRHFDGELVFRFGSRPDFAGPLVLRTVQRVLVDELQPQRQAFLPEERGEVRGSSRIHPAAPYKLQPPTPIAACVVPTWSPNALFSLKNVARLAPRHGPDAVLSNARHAWPVHHSQFPLGCPRGGFPGFVLWCQDNLSWAGGGSPTWRTSSSGCSGGGTMWTWWMGRGGKSDLLWHIDNGGGKCFANSSIQVKKGMGDHKCRRKSKSSG